MPWHDSDRLVFGCFLGGAYGFAVRYLLLHSRNVLRTGYYEPDIRDDGAAHRMLTRSGLIRADGDSHVDIGIYQIGESLGLDDFHVKAWTEAFDDSTVAAIRHAIDESVQDVAEDDASKKWVWVDHISPVNARAIFPRARIFYLGMDINRAFRNYCIKNRFEHTDILSRRGLHDLTTIDDDVLRLLGARSRHLYKHHLRETHKLLHLQSKYLQGIDDSHAVDSVSLFHSKDWTTEYLSLCSYCGLDPDVTAAGPFVTSYRDRQFSRDTYQPNPGWNWVRLGPNRPGRW